MSEDIKDWREGLSLDDFPDIYRDIAEFIGMPAALELGEKMGGEPFYLPKIDAFLVKKRNQLIKADLAAGMSYRLLARKYKKSVRWIREIEKTIKDDRQIDMF
jgi:Mor family transcriptional regulator